ncbi:hypothetical protein DNF23_54005, partial [Pseudomonas syringae pv. pisi]
MSGEQDYLLRITSPQVMYGLLGYPQHFGRHLLAHTFCLALENFLEFFRIDRFARPALDHRTCRDLRFQNFAATGMLKFIQFRLYP